MFIDYTLYRCVYVFKLIDYLVFVFSRGLLLAVGYWLLAFGFLACSQ